MTDHNPMRKSQTERMLTGELDESSPFFKSLMLESAKELDNFEKVESYQVAPKPGFCLKTWNKSGRKVFINVCTSTLILKPKDLSEREVREIVESEDPTRFRVPMGIGEAHKELDKEGKESDAYDIVIHSEFFKKLQNSGFFKEFFITLVFDGLESKYDLELNRDYRILKNRKAMGTLQTQSVRNKSKPVIMEMDPYMYELEKQNIVSHKSDALTEISNTSLHVEPEYKITCEPSIEEADFVVVEVELPNLQTAKNALLDVGEDCLILHAKDGRYKLDIDLPVDVNNDAAGAQFNRKTKVLTVTIPTLKSS